MANNNLLQRKLIEYAVKSFKKQNSQWVCWSQELLSSVDIDYANHFQTRKDDSSTKGTRTVQKLPLDIQCKLNEVENSEAATRIAQKDRLCAIWRSLFSDCTRDTPGSNRNIFLSILYLNKTLN